MVFITADVMNVSSGALQAWLPNMCFCCAAFGQVLLLPSEIKTYLSKPAMNNVFAWLQHTDMREREYPWEANIQPTICHTG